MKKRISCLLIALVMLLALLPAVSLTSFAGEGSQEPVGPEVGTYEYYAERGMWYGTGSEWNEQSPTPLIAFVDLTHLDADDETLVAMNKSDSQSNPNKDTVRFLYSPVKEAYTINGNNGKHTYIKIVDGQQKGKFYAISNSSGLDNAIYIDEWGNIANLTAKTTSDTVKGSLWTDGVLFPFKAIRYEDIAVPWYFQRWTDSDGSFGTNFSWDGITYNKDTQQLTSGQAFDNYNDALYGYFLDDYVSPVNGGVFTMENVTRVHGTDTGENKMLPLFTNTGIGLTTNGTKYWMMNSSIAAGKWNQTHNAYQKVFSATPVFSVTSSLSYDFSTEGEGYAYTNDKAGTGVVATSMIMLANKTTSASSMGNSLSYTRDYVNDITIDTVQRNERLSSFNYMGAAPTSTVHSQTLFVRSYNVQLTDEQYKQNHLADLFYYYNIDLGERAVEDFVKHYDAATNLSIGLHNSGDEAEEYLATVESLNTIVENSVPPHMMVGNYEYYAKRGMWYGTGDAYDADTTPLMAFVDLTHLDADDATLVAANDATLASNPNTGTVRFIHSTAANDYSLENGSAGKHTYIRIVDGKLAGKFYAISNSSKQENAIYIDEWGNVANKTNLTELPTQANDSLWSGNFIFTMRALDLSELGSKWYLGHWAASAASPGNHVFWNNTLYNGTTGVDGQTYNSYNDGFYNAFVDEHINPANQGQYTMEHVTKVFGIDNAAGKDLDTFARRFFMLSTGEAGNYWRFSSSYITGSDIHHAYEQKVTLNPVFSMSTAITYDFTDKTFTDALAGTPASITASALFPNENTSSQAGGNFLSKTSEYTLSSFNYMAAMPTVHMHSQSMFVRSYNTALTEQQMKQNHLADLMYYYNIDLKTLDASAFTAYYDEATALDIGLHSTGEEAEAYASTKAQLQAWADCESGEHIPVEDDGSCLTERLCSICGDVAVAKRDTHETDEDDGDCMTAVTCKHCTHVMTPSADEHVAGEDDGNCLTPVKCVNCDQNAIAGQSEHSFTSLQKDGEGHWYKCSRTDCEEVESQTKTSHTPEADDNDCTTPTVCEDCGWEITAAPHAEHSFTVLQRDEDGHWYKCEYCNVTDDVDNHTPAANDDCTKDTKCSVCGEVTTAAKSAHTGGTATCTAKAECEVCQKEYGELAAHTPEADDGDCTTAVKCSVCDAETTAANGAHTYGEDDICTADGCNAENPDKGLSGGAIAGITSGSVAVAGGGGFAIWWFIFRKKKLS